MLILCQKGGIQPKTDSLLPNVFRLLPTVNSILPSLLRLLPDVDTILPNGFLWGPNCVQNLGGYVAGMGGIQHHLGYLCVFVVILTRSSQMWHDCSQMCFDCSQVCFNCSQICLDCSQLVTVSSQTVTCSSQINFFAPRMLIISGRRQGRHGRNRSPLGMIVDF